MGVKKQFAMLKENWLIVVFGLIVLIFISGGNGIVGDLAGGFNSLGQEKGYRTGMTDDVLSASNYPESNDGNFAPEVEERKVTRSSSLSTEIERGEFGEAENQLKNIVGSSEAYLLNERVNRNGEGWRGYFYGSYSLKVETGKYDSVVAQLKEIGEVQSFNENALDVTGRYDDLEIEIGVEKERLARYMEMYDEAEEVSDKIDLNDRIFNQERRIKYLEDSLRNIDNKVDYSSISFSMSEERSEWTDIVLIKLSSLIRGFVDSVNSLLEFVFIVVSWVVAFFVGLFFWKRFKKRK